MYGGQPWWLALYITHSLMLPREHGWPTQLNVVSMLAQRRECWPNIQIALGQYSKIAWYAYPWKHRHCSRQKTLNRCWVNIAPPSTTLDQRQTSIDSTSCVWDRLAQFSSDKCHHDLYDQVHNMIRNTPSWLMKTHWLHYNYSKWIFHRNDQLNVVLQWCEWDSAFSRLADHIYINMNSPGCIGSHVQISLRRKYYWSLNWDDSATLSSVLPFINIYTY